MTKLPLIAFATLIIAGGLAAPSLAATATQAKVPNGFVPYCDSSGELTMQRDALAAELKLNASDVDAWNGCLKVTSVHNGKTVISFYDPDSLRLIATA